MEERMFLLWFLFMNVSIVLGISISSIINYISDRKNT